MPGETSPAPWLRRLTPLVWLAVLQILVVSLLAVAPRLHEHFHLHSNNDSHHCLVVEFQAGSVGPLASLTLFAPPVPQLLASRLELPGATTSLPAAHLLGAAFDRGPPARA